MGSADFSRRVRRPWPPAFPPQRFVVSWQLAGCIRLKMVFGNLEVRMGEGTDSVLSTLPRSPGLSN